VILIVLSFQARSFGKKLEATVARRS
jgi:hypothetical protein